MSRHQPVRQAAIFDRYSQRFRELKQELDRLQYFCKGTVLRRMMKCGKQQCACRRDPSKRHGPYFEWTYKAKGTTVHVKLSADAAPIYKAATRQHKKLKSILTRLERLSRTALAHLAKKAQAGRSH